MHHNQDQISNIVVDVLLSILHGTKDPFHETVSLSKDGKKVLIVNALDSEVNPGVLFIYRKEKDVWVEECCKSFRYIMCLRDEKNADKLKMSVTFDNINDKQFYIRMYKHAHEPMGSTLLYRLGRQGWNYVLSMNNASLRSPRDIFNASIKKLD